LRGKNLTPCNGATPKESRIREIRTCGSMRGRRSKDLLLLYCGQSPRALICVNDLFRIHAPRTL
ncbi:MAG: hypothetical protein WA977_05510, partial [Halobacteriota archaeon]